MSDVTEVIHLRREYAGYVECGVTGPVRVTHVFREVTCQPCVDAEYQRRHGNHDTDVTCRACDPETAKPVPTTTNTTETTYADYNSPTGSRVFHVRIDRHWDGVAITVAHHDILNRAFPSQAEADAYLNLLETQAAAGTPMWLIEAAAGAWTAAAAVVDDKELIASINATMDAAQPEPVDVSDIVDAPRGPSFADLKRNARNDYSRTRVSSQPPTEAELDRIRAHAHGIVTTAPGQPWTLLRAIVRRGLAVEHEVHGRHVIASVRLNQRGLQLAGEQIGAAA